VDCTSQPVLGPSDQPFTISKKWKNPSSALRRKRTSVQALPWFSTCSLSLWASDLKSRYSGPSPIHNACFHGYYVFGKAHQDIVPGNVLSNYTKNKTGVSGRYYFGDPPLLWEFPQSEILPGEVLWNAKTKFWNFLYVSICL
jgi:hypothetical protein